MAALNGASDAGIASTAPELTLRENINFNGVSHEENNTADNDAKDIVNDNSHGSTKDSENCFGRDSQNGTRKGYQESIRDDANNNMKGAQNCVQDGTNSSIDEHTTNSAKSPQPTVPSKSSQVVDTAPHGSVSIAKNLYKSKKDSDKNWTWVDKYPDDVAEAAENEETAKYAIIIRNIKSQDSRKKLEAHSIIIQSPWLKKALNRHILNDYPGITCELSRLEFEPPFKPFVHRWGELLKFRTRMDVDQTTKAHTNLLHDILKCETGDSIKAFEDYVLNDVITFDHLWMIYQPGGIVVSDNDDGPAAAFELESSEYIKNDCGRFLRLKCECVDWSGKYFGRRSVNIDLHEFHGTKKIQMLHAFPLRFHQNKELIKTKLIERGRKFESLCGYQYKAYSGVAITWDREGRELPIQVSGRVIIDTYAFNCFSPYRTRRVQAMNSKDIDMLSDHKYKHDLASLNSGIEDAVKKPGPYSDEVPWMKLTPYHQMLCTSRVRGYSLKLKKWLDFLVEFVSDITWNTNAFDSLVLPEDQKELILGFSESQVENRDAFDDVIQGKGRGVIMLLSGPPGVGKTLTAEAVAENMQVPLHTINSGDLGSDSWAVESRLTNILELVARWNAILLLDECDVFLEKRSLHDLERNKVVSIFLRTLEYYEGVLFMTTNRVENIDPAFQSRIHISMEYPDLTTSSRRQIWRNFLKVSSQSTEFSEEDLDELASVPLNGRQIKNILKTAQLLASRKKMPLNRGFVGTVLAIERRRPEMRD